MHCLRRPPLRFLRSPGSYSTVKFRLQGAVLRSQSIPLLTPTPVIPTHLVRWKFSTSKRSISAQQEPASSKPSENIPSLASTIQDTDGFRPEYDLTPEEKEAYMNIHSESNQDDVDYIDLYARSRAADDETDEIGKRTERVRILDEPLKPEPKVKPKEQGDPARSIIQTEDFKSATETASSSKASSKKRRSTNAPVTPHETVYVGNLFYDLAAEDVRAHFEQFGTVLRMNIVHDNRGISKGFAYIQYSTVEEAKKAIEKQHEKIFGGRPIIVRYARNSTIPIHEEHDATNTVYVGNIPYELTDRDLQDLFSDVVNVVDIRIPIDRRSGMMRGFAHVEFLNVEAARVGKEILARKAPYGRKILAEFTNLKRVGMLHSEQNSQRLAEKARRNQEEVADREEEAIINERVAARAAAAATSASAASTDIPQSAAKK